MGETVGELKERDATVVGSVRKGRWGWRTITMTSRVASFIRLLVFSLCDEYGHVWTENVAGAHFPGLKVSVLLSSGCRMRICHSSTSRTRPNALRRVHQTNTSCLIGNHVSAFITSSTTPAVWRSSVALTQGSYEPFNLPIECMPHGLAYEETSTCCKNVNAPTKPSTLFSPPETACMALSGPSQ